MRQILRRLKDEPVFLLGVMEAAIGLLVALDVLDPTVGGAIGAIIAALGAGPAIGVARKAVTPVRKVAKLMDKSVGEVNELLKKVSL